MLYSYDIFDTLITRITYSPSGIFYIMQKELKRADSFPAYLADNFVDIRIEAEVHAKTNAKYICQEDVYLKDIYIAMCDFVKLTEDEIEYLIRLECKIEEQCLLPINKNIEELKKHVRNNDKVILISDMYLNKNIIRNILVKIDDIFEKIPIYVSSDYGMCKSTGRLYAYIRKELGIEYSDWVHVGDNYKSDFLIPKTLGITCIHRQSWKEYNWIKELNATNQTNTLEYEVGFGVAKYLCINSEKNELQELGMSFAGIVLYSYVDWLIQNAVKQGLEVLYFIARDGYILQKIADKLIKYYNLEIETKYIYGSRKVWRDVDTELKQNNLKKYFEQNVKFDKKIAFVDANGYGVSIANVASILDNLWKNEISVYLFSFHRMVNTEKCCFHNYCYNQTGLIELLSSATHGSTIEYKDEYGIIKPVLKIEDNFENIDEYIHGVMLYTDAILYIFNRLKLKLDFRNLVIKVMYRPWYNGGITLKKLWEILNCTNKYSKNILESNFKLQANKRDFIYKIIIYGAGEAGKKIFNEYNSDDKYHIVAWTDINYEEYSKKGYPVSSISDAIKEEYDYIVIAMVNKIAIRSAKCILKELGVPDSKIKKTDS